MIKLYTRLTWITYKGKVNARVYIWPEMEGVFLVAVADGKVVGFADFHPVSANDVELAAIYVLPEEQRHSIGTRLLEAGIDRSKKPTR